jgi:phage I-like protein
MPDQPATPAAVQPPAPSAIPDAPAEHMIPKSRLDDVLAKLDAAQKKADALEKAQQDADRKRLEEANEYKKLYETTQTELSSLKPKAEQVDAYEKTLTEILEAQVAELPDEFKDVVPDGLSTKQKLDWLAKNKSKFMKAEPFDIGAGKRGTKPDKKVELTPEEKEMAAKYGMTEEQYAKYKKE